MMPYPNHYPVRKIAIKADSPYQTAALMEIRPAQPNRMYWPNGSGWRPYEKAEVLHDYGIVSNTQEESEALRQFMDDFPPPVYAPEGVKDLDGFLSKDGKFYCCGQMGHTWLAERLLWVNHHDTGDFAFGTDEDYLMGQFGYLALHFGNISLGKWADDEYHAPTESQMAWIETVLQRYPYGQDSAADNLRESYTLVCKYL